ncbi:MAG: MFS transporter [Hyphomonadaceae bacterium]|nr:MFS transporter [Hyphomonadaceae bacterium]
MSEGTAETKSGRAAGAALTIALCFAVAVLEGYDIQALGVTAPKIAPELGLHPEQMGFVFSISNIGIVAGAAVGGWLMDRFGRKPIFIASVITFGVFTFATIFVTSFETLFAARLLTGVGFGAALPGLMAISAEISSPDKRASTATMMFCGMPLGGGLAALLTSNLPADFDWRLVFMVGGLLPLVVALLITFLMKETHTRAERADSAKTGVFTALFGQGRAAPTLLIWIALLPTYIVLYIILNWLPTLVVDKGFDRSVAPQASMAFNFASVIGALVIGQLADRFGFRWPLSLALVALIGVLWGLGHATDFTMVLVFSALVGVTLMGAQYAFLGVAASYYPEIVRGTGSGAAAGMGRVGSIIGPMAAGMLLGAGASAATVLTALVPAAAVAALAVGGLGFFKRGGD